MWGAQTRHPWSTLGPTARANAHETEAAKSQVAPELRRRPWAGSSQGPQPEGPTLSTRPQTLSGVSWLCPSLGQAGSASLGRCAQGSPT